MNFFAFIFILLCNVSFASDCSSYLLPPNQKSIDFTPEGRLVFENSKLKGEELTKSIQEKIIQIKQAIRSGDSKAVVAWIDSPERAAYYYETLKGTTKFQGLDAQVIRDSVGFKDSYKIKDVPGSVVTYSFEKETTNPIASFYFKPKNVPFEEWEQMSHADRTEMLRHLKAEFFDKVERTEIGHPFLGKISQEGTEVIEIKHRSFEVSPILTNKQIQSISNELGETHSFHFHVVFEAPHEVLEKYKTQFLTWYNQLDTYAILKGYEEGLHQSGFTSSQGITHMLDRTVGEMGDKFRTVGLRSASTYGKQNTDKVLTLGLEFRDVTRNMDQIEPYMKNTSKSVSERVWEKSKARYDDNLDIFVKDKNDMQLLATEISEQFQLDIHILEKIYGADPAFFLPFTKFENFRIWNYQTHTYEMASEQVISRIKNARKLFVEEVKKTINEMDGMIKKGEHINSEDLKQVLRMDISAWAKKAKVAELYKNF